MATDFGGHGDVLLQDVTEATFPQRHTFIIFISLEKPLCPLRGVKEAQLPEHSVSRANSLHKDPLSLHLGPHSNLTWTLLVPSRCSLTVFLPLEEHR